MTSRGLVCFLCCIIYLVQLNMSEHPVRSGTAWRVRWRWSGACLCVTSHFVVERKCSDSQQTVLTVCHSVTSQTVRLNSEIYRSTLTAWDTDVSTLIVSPSIHDERIFHTYCREDSLVEKYSQHTVILPSLSVLCDTHSSYSTSVALDGYSLVTFLLFVLEMKLRNIFIIS